MDGNILFVSVDQDQLKIDARPIKGSVNESLAEVLFNGTREKSTIAILASLLASPGRFWAIIEEFQRVRK